jgi:recombinational DNA repair protein (RecF pathway)
MMQSHQRLSQYKIQNYENKIIQRLQKSYFLFYLDLLIEHLLTEITESDVCFN